MKRKVALFAAGLIVAASGVAAAAGTVGEYRGHPIVNVVVNGKQVKGEVPGINMEGTTLVPLKVVSEALGAKVSWDQSTSTASITTAAASEPPVPAKQAENTQKRKQVEQVRDIYEKAEAYIGNLELVRERIRIAKEFYDIKKNDQQFRAMTELYWKTFEESYSRILTETSSAEMNEAKQAGVLGADLLKALDAAHNSMMYYQYSYDHFTRYVSLKQDTFLDFYITSYATAFDDEMNAKAKFAEARKQFERTYMKD